MIAVFIDSNHLFSNNDLDFSRVWSHERLDQYAEIIESVDLYEQIKIVIPSIVFSELHKQQVEKYKAKSEEIKKLVLPAWKIEDGLSIQKYKEWIEKEHRAFVELGVRGMVTCETAEVPLDCFKNVIARAIEKKAPFEGKDKQSDKGFKDVLIWETIIDYKNRHPEERVIWITQDKRCGNDFLKKEYTDSFKEEIEICRTREEFETVLNKVLEYLGIDAKPLIESKEESLVKAYFCFFLFNKAREIASLNGIPMLRGIHFDILALDIETESDTEYVAFVQLEAMYDEVSTWELSIKLNLTLEDDCAYVEYRNAMRGLVITERELLSEVDGFEF